MQNFYEILLLTDLKSHLNELNLKLQGKHQTIVNLYGQIRGFENKIERFKFLLEKHDFFHFFRAVKSTLKKLRILRKFHISLIQNTLTQLQKNSKINLVTLRKSKEKFQFLLSHLQFLLRT